MKDDERIALASLSRNLPVSDSVNDMRVDYFVRKWRRLGWVSHNGELTKRGKHVAESLDRFDSEMPVNDLDVENLVGRLNLDLDDTVVYEDGETDAEEDAEKLDADV